MPTTISKEDEGKEVRDAEGTLLGLVTEVDGETAYVDPDPSLTDGLRTMFSQGDADEDAYVVKADAIADVTDDALHLQGTL